MDLFLQPSLSFEKTAAGTSMPEDPNAWPQEIIQELYKQVPFMTDFSPHVEMDKVDAERGYGFGNITVTHRTEVQQGETPEAMAAAGLRQIRIPIIIKDGKLSPLDILVTTDSKILPLTENRLRTAIFRPQAFDVTSRTPGDQSIIGQLYPPYRQNVGGGGGTALTVGMGKESSVLAHIAPTMNQTDINMFRSALDDADIKLAFQNNPEATLESVKTILEAEPDKVASAKDMVRPTVVQLVAHEIGYLAKTANHRYWNPQVEMISRGEAIQRFGAEMVKAADLSGAATTAEGAETVTPEPDSDMEQMAPIQEFGLYKAMTKDGKEIVGYAIPNIIDIDGTELPLTMFTNGSQAAVQGEVLGVPVQGAGVDLPSSDVPGGYGAFFNVEGGTVKATIPIELNSSSAMPDQPSTYQGETFDGRPVSASVQPGIQVIMGTEDGKMLVPEHWSWLPLAQSDAIALASSEPEVDKTSSAKQHFASIEIRGDSSSFSLQGPALDKVASHFLDVDEAMFLLAGLGVEPKHGTLKLAEAMTGEAPVRVKIGRVLRLAEDIHKDITKEAEALARVTAAMRKPLIKEAAVLPDPEAVDTVLSLGFINPENLTAFISALPQLDASQSNLCELLFAARVGLNDVPEGALESSIRGVEEVIEGLKTLAFQGPQSYN